MVFVVKDIIVSSENKTILISISFKRYFSHPEKSKLKSSLTLRRHCNSGPWPRVYKTFFVLNSTEHKTYPANKC